MASGVLVAGKYRIDVPLGAGGMSAVYGAVHVGLEQRVAIKVLHPQFAADLKVVQRFIREAKASARISGEHVGRVIDVGATEEGSPYIALELLEGEDLGDHVDRRGPLPIAEAVDLVLQACDGIARAHAVGIIHRDIKPSNLFLTHRDDRPCVKVIDFGISKVISGDGHALTQTTEIVGSPQYMSPEQVKASRDVDARTDVWSLGCVLYELLTAKVPFEAPSVMLLGSIILNNRHVSVREHRPEVPLQLSAIVDRCLAKETAARPSTVVELAAALAPFALNDAGLVDSMRRLGSQVPLVPASSVRSVVVSSETGPSVEFGEAELDEPLDEDGPTAPRRWLAIGAGLAVGIIAVVAVFVLRRAPPVAAKEPEPATVTSAAVATPGPIASSEPAAVVVAPVAPAAAPEPKPLPATTARPTRRPATKPAAAQPVAETVTAPPPAPPAPKPAGTVSHDRHGDN